jgi:hypothetical protein
VNCSETAHKTEVLAHVLLFLLKIVRKSAVIILFLFMASVFISSAGQTNYFCIVCGKGPLSGHIWLHPRGAICDDCEKLPDRCSVCGLPVKPGDGCIKTGDGRFICRFDKTNVVMTADQAKDLFEQVREEVVDIYGPQFALKNTEVSVNLFDVDYWSEKGMQNGLHKYGFASSRPSGNDGWTHEVVMLSGRTREEMESVAAHEYTHLWINENRAQSRHIDGDTIEAICELTAYKLMQHKNLPEMQKRILENPYTNGKIKDLVAVEHEGGTDYVLNWVKTSNAETFEVDASQAPLPVTAPVSTYIAGPAPVSKGLKFSGVMAFGKERLAVVNGKEFAVGDQKTVTLRGGAVVVRCLEVHDGDVKVEVAGKMLTLEQGEEKILQ